MSDIETDDTSLTIRRTFDAPRERVYRAFTDPDDLEAWQSIGDLTVEVHTIEPEAGGSLSVSHASGDDRFDFEGEFLEAVESERLVYTLRGVGEPYDGVESRTSVEFRAVEDGTEVVFTEEQVDPEMVEGSATTWNEMLANLEEVLAEP